VSWSTASRARRAVELEKIGTKTQFVLLDLRDAARDVPALRDELARCTSTEEREQLAFEWFEKHPQPAKRSNWIGSEDGGPAIGGAAPYPTFRTPDWPGGRLPSLEDDRTSVTPAPQPRPTRLPPLPPDVNLFLFASIQKAVRLFDKGNSLNAVADTTIFNPHDAGRVRWLWQRDYLSLNDSDVLLIDWRIGRVDKRYALRVWDERSEIWLDPNKT
jgi:hypothetical protein